MSTETSAPMDRVYDPNGHRPSWPTVRVMDIGGQPHIIESPSDCWYCGRHLRLKIEDDGIRATNPCEWPDGVTMSIRLAVPSGKLVVDDDLRPIYDGFSDDFLTYNSLAGQAQVVHAMAALGCAYGPVGNTCPSLYRTGDGTYVIATLAWNDDEDSDEEEIIPEGWTELAGICTDLWAYSIADHDDFLSRGGSLESPGDTRSVVEVPAGTYRFTHHTGERSFKENETEPTIYAHIERETNQ
jgi:hypothetical protein